VILNQNKPHQKHATIARPALGEFHRNELAILGMPCVNIQQLARQIISRLAPQCQIAYVDADHKVEPLSADSMLAQGTAVEFTDHITSRKLVYQQQFNSFEQKALFNNQDLVIVNGNHFKAKYQIAVIDKRKPLTKKLDKLTDVQMVLLANGMTALPDELLAHNNQLAQVPVLSIHQTEEIAAFIRQWLCNRMPKLNGLVLAGGKSTRMQTDKGSLTYSGKSQRLHTYELLNAHCVDTYVSYANDQSVNQQEGLPYITDKYLGLGPMGGILSAFQQQPNAAWLTVACDLPYLSAETINYLIQHRNPSKLATAFLDPAEKFPEPLITIWEPRAYPVLLKFLSMGYSCPRKVLINSDIELLRAPNLKDLQNVNHPHERDEAMQQIKVSG
jgi:molybdopterin-guanine dinucleotide biosynthesis protein A